MGKRRALESLIFFSELLSTDRFEKGQGLAGIIVFHYTPSGGHTRLQWRVPSTCSQMVQLNSLSHQTKPKGINVQNGLIGRTEFIEVGRERREGKDIEIN